MVYQNKIRSNQVEMDVCNKDGFDVLKKKKNRNFGCCNIKNIWNWKKAVENMKRSRQEVYSLITQH